MIDISKLNYQIKDDLETLIDAERIDIETLSKESGISKVTIYEILNTNKTTKSVYEKFYSYAYELGYRFNQVKEEFLKESNNNVLFHGSKHGIENINYNGSRNNCDFGNGFYLGESFSSTANFICENDNSCVYSFILDNTNLNIVKFSCSLEWMLAICYFRGYLNEYKESKIIKDIINKINNADLIIAPIADNKMFYIMTLFANGDISDNVAIHSLSAANLGNQYIIKSEKALNYLKPIEKYYISNNEREEYIEVLKRRTDYIESKLKLAKREYRFGKYIEEILE